MDSLDPPIKHLLVDLDGTLLGNRNFLLSVSFVRQSLHALKKYGGYRKAVAALWSINAVFKKPNREFTNDHRVVELFSKKMDLKPEEGRSLIKDQLSLIFPELKRHFFPVPGSKDFLDWAKNHYPMTLATNPVWPPEIIELRVRWAGIDPTIFQSITHVRRMHACKPAKEYYEEILELEKLKPEDCLLIGDDVKMDLPATQVGIRVFIVGHYKRLTHLKHPKAKALAWRGSYKALRTLLENSPKAT